MKKVLISLTAVFLSAFFIIGLSFPQTQKKTVHLSARGWGAGEAYSRWYNPGNVTSIRGEVERVQIFQPVPGMSAGLELIVKTGSETISVHVGPLGYIKEQGVKFEPNDGVEVKGSKVSLAGRQPFIMAAQVVKGASVLKLRDDKGIPLW